jgi:hypothetical protein
VSDGSADERILSHIEVTQKLRKGDYRVEVPVAPRDEVGRLGESLQALARTLETRGTWCGPAGPGPISRSSGWRGAIQRR